MQICVWEVAGSNLVGIFGTPILFSLISHWIAFVQCAVKQGWLAGGAAQEKNNIQSTQKRFCIVNRGLRTAWNIHNASHSVSVYVLCSSRPTVNNAGPSRRIYNMSALIAQLVKQVNTKVKGPRFESAWNPHIGYTFLWMYGKNSREMREIKCGNKIKNKKTQR